MGIIGSIRKHSWVAVLIVGLAIVLFILGDLTKNSRGGDNTVGKVNGSSMSYQRLESLTNELKSNYMMQYQVSQVPAEMESRFRSQAWENFVDETLLGEQMDKLGIIVGEEEEADMYTGTFIDATLRQLFTNPETGEYDKRAASSYYENADQMDAQTRTWWNMVQKSVKQNRQMQKYYGLLSSSMYMPKAFAEQIGQYSANRADVRLVMQSYQSVADETLEDADYQNYYNNHKEEFVVVDELRDLEYVVFPVMPSPQDMAAIQADVMSTWDSLQHVADSDLVYFVNTMSDRSYDSLYKSAESFDAPFSELVANSTVGELIAPQVVPSANEWQMAKVLNIAMRPDSLRASLCLVFGGDFDNAPRNAEMARQLADSAMDAYAHGMAAEQVVEKYSDQKNFGDKGDLGWMTDGSYDLNLGGAYLRLNERIVNTPVGGSFVVDLPAKQGYAVVMVTEKTQPHKKYRVAQIARGIYPSSTTINTRSSEAGMLAANNRTEAEMVAAAQQSNLSVRSARVVAGSENLANGVPNSREIVRWAFGDDVKVGTVAEKVFRCDDLFVVVALKDVIKSGYATLEQVRPMIEHQVMIEKKAEKMMAQMNEAAQQSKDINSIAAKVGVAVDTLQGIGFADNYLGRYGMELKVLATASNATGLVGPIKGANGVYMLQIDGKQTGEAPSTEATQRNMERAYGQKWNAINGLLRERAKIKDQRVKFF